MKVTLFTGEQIDLRSIEDGAMRLETWELFERAEAGTQFYGDDHEKYVKPEQRTDLHLEGCVVRLRDGKILHWSRLYGKRNS